jgi:hypothetical protein
MPCLGAMITESKYEVNLAMNGARTVRKKIVLANNQLCRDLLSQVDMIERAGRVRLHDAFPAS